MPTAARRRQLGAFYTPDDVADRLVALTLPAQTARVCDPACGDGAFLLASARLLESRGVDRRTIVGALLWGIDVDPDAVTATRARLTDRAGISPGDHVVVGDGLTHAQWNGRFDAVVGNPPFLNQLESATVRTTAYRWDTGPYADTAFLFLLAGLDLARDGGRVTLIQPQSIAAARDATAIRDHVMRRAALVGMWTCDEVVFDASVRVCAPVLEKGLAPRRAVRRWSGRAFAPAPTASVDGATTWSAALTREVPMMEFDDAGRVGDVATATAGFRDQFYGLVPHVVDAQDGDLPKLVTCGAIDANRCRWGERPVRFAGARWTHPCVDVGGIAEEPLRRWVHERLVPKVVLATQTRVLEAAVDVDGRWVPSTPVIAVHTSPNRLWHLGAVFAAPPVSAWAVSRYAGVALAAGAIKLSARQVLEIPLPADRERWDDAATLLRDGDLLGAARRMNDAYRADAAVLEWWRRRLPAQ